jgi:hypothetical protein
MAEGVGALKYPRAIFLNTAHERKQQGTPAGEK